MQIKCNRRRREETLGGTENAFECIFDVHDVNDDFDDDDDAFLRESTGWCDDQY